MTDEEMSSVVAAAVAAEREFCAREIDVLANVVALRAEGERSAEDMRHLAAAMRARSKPGPIR